MSDVDDDMYEPGPVEGSILSSQHAHISQEIWEGQEPAHLRLRTNFKSYWDTVKAPRGLPEAVLKPVRDAGLEGVYSIGSFRHDAGLITAFVERWRPETHTFHLPFGEATITLEDVHYILGLPTGGRPVINSFGSPSKAQLLVLVNDLLGVVPGDNEWQKSGLRISWLVQQFGACHRLDMSTPDYQTQLLFHIRAHMLLIIGSLFPNTTGNTIQFHLLHYVHDPAEVGTYSWGSAALGYLYHHLCSSSTVKKRGTKKEVCGSKTLLQVWIYEHFPFLAPTLKTTCAILFPLALRWKVPKSNVRSTSNRARHGRYELDDMHIDQICWRPYRHFPTVDLPSIMGRRLWSAQCPLIFHTIIEWYYPDRVTRQFGFVQDIPTRSPRPGHDASHEFSFYANLGDGVMETRDVQIHQWLNRGADALSPPMYVPTRHNEAVSGYDAWFQSITRRRVVDVRQWRQQEGFQGSQSFHGGGGTYHTARPVMPEASTYPQLWEPWQRAPSEDVGSDMGDRGAWDHMLDDSARYASHASGSAHHATPPFQSQMTYAGGSQSTSHMAGSFGAFQDHSYMTFPGGSQSGSQMTGAWDMGGSFGGFQDPSQFDHSQMTFGGSSQMTFGGHSQSHLQTPQAQGFREFAPVQPSSSSEEDPNEEPHLRQQPPRNVKGKGRRCHTGSHVLWEPRK